MYQLKYYFPEIAGFCGLGLRNEFLDSLLNFENPPIDFLEIAPENWIGIGGRRAKYFHRYTERYPVIGHGLSLSVGGPLPLDLSFLQKLKTFFNQHNICFYSEHLSYCTDDKGQLYDLMPIPFTEEAVDYVANRVIQIQEILERQIALENISYYATLPGEMTEAEFICAVLEKANCLLLLDVNNVYVNSVNHRYSADDFLNQMPKERIAYLHIAGHWQKNENLIIDTHGDDIVAPVWQLLEKTYQRFGVLPTLLERDNAIPSLDQLLKEVNHLKMLQNSYSRADYVQFA